MANWSSGAGLAVALGSHWGRIGVALGSHWGRIGLALGWLWGRNRLAINTLWGGFDVALRSHSPISRPCSAFFILCLFGCHTCVLWRPKKLTVYDASSVTTR